MVNGNFHKSSGGDSRMSDKKLKIGGDGLLPTPTEYGEICSDPNMAADYHCQMQYLIPLCTKLQFCHKCSMVDGDKTVCYCDKGCYLEELGLLDISNIHSASSLVSYLSLYFGKYTAMYGELLKEKEDLEKEREKLEGVSHTLKQGQKELEKNEKEFQAKKAKLGRPSDFENRILKYEVYWVQANPKPSLRALGKKFDPPLSPMQVSRDLERLGYKTKSKE